MLLGCVGGSSVRPAQLGLAAKLRLSSLSIRIHSCAPLGARVAPVTIALVFLEMSPHPGDRQFACPRILYTRGSQPPGWRSGCPSYLCDNQYCASETGG